MVGYKAGFEYVLDLAIYLYLLYLAMSLFHWYFLSFLNEKWYSNSIHLYIVMQQCKNSYKSEHTTQNSNNKNQNSSKNVISNALNEYIHNQ